MTVRFSRIPGATNVPTQVMQTLVEEISSGRLKSGDVLPSESEIAAQTGAGMSSVREALASLQGMGVIAVRHGAGRQVKGLTFAAISDPRISTVAIDGQMALNIWEVRRALETASIRQAVERATENDIAAIEGAAQAMADAVEGGELGVEEDGEVHRAIAKATGNELYVWLNDSIGVLIAGTRSRGLSHPGRPAIAIREHFEMAESIRRRDADAAEALIIQHLETQRADALEFIAEERASSPPETLSKHKE